MKPGRQHATPLVIIGADEGRQAVPLSRLRLEKPGTSEGGYDEKWLQHLVHRHPEVLPINEIEPAFTPLIPVGMELPTINGGYIDNFFVTPAGNLVFAECKLWRNSEARREVVAQVLDYVESFPRWGYAGLENSIKRATLPDGSHPLRRLHEHVSEFDELDESDFIDAVSRNLRLGRGLFLIVGDGIREEAEALTAHVQAHAGSHFAIALVELTLFALPRDHEVLVNPRIVARTVNIERGIVRIDDDRISVTHVDTAVKTASSGQRQSLSAEEFYAKLEVRDPALPDRLRALLAELEPLGVTSEFKRSLTLRWHAIDGTALNLAYILTNGDVWTDAVHSMSAQKDIRDLTRQYVERLAESIGGTTRSIGKSAEKSYVMVNGHVPKIEHLLKHSASWIDEIAGLAKSINQRVESSN